MSVSIYYGEFFPNQSTAFKIISQNDAWALLNDTKRIHPPQYKTRSRQIQVSKQLKRKGSRFT